MTMADIAIAFWILTVFTGLFIVMPSSRLLSERGPLTCSRLASGFVRMTSVTTVAAWVLSRFQLLNGLTLILVYAAWALTLWIARRRNDGIARATSETLRRNTLRAASLWERSDRRDRLRALLGAGASDKARMSPDGWERACPAHPRCC